MYFVCVCLCPDILHSHRDDQASNPVVLFTSAVNVQSEHSDVHLFLQTRVICGTFMTKQCSLCMCLVCKFFALSY